MRQIHDIKLDHESTLGHEMQVRVHSDETADWSPYVEAGREFMISLVNDLAWNSTRHGTREHELSDGAIIKVKQSYGVQTIDIYPPEEELEKKHYGIFSFKPRPDAPTAIIIESESENATDGIELYFDDRIQAGGIHTQDNTLYSEEVTEPVQLDDKTQRDNIYSLWMDARSTAGENCSSWSQGYLNRKWSVDYNYFGSTLRTCDGFDGGYLWYYGLTTRYAYVGGRLLYEAYYQDDILGVGEVDGKILVYILINRYSTKIRLLTAPIPKVDYEVHTEDPYHKTADLTEVDAEFIEIQSRHHPLSAFTFSSDGSVGSLSIYDWHDGSSITDYTVEFKVEENDDGELELITEIGNEEKKYVVETITTSNAPDVDSTAEAGKTITRTVGLGVDFSADAREIWCIYSTMVSGLECVPRQPPCDCSPAFDEVDYVHFCGEGSHELMSGWVLGKQGGCLAYGPESITGNVACTGYFPPTLLTNVWWWNTECFKEARQAVGFGSATCGLANVSTYTPAADQSTPIVYGTKSTKTITPVQMPFAQVIGPHGELLKATRDYNYSSNESGTSSSGYISDGSARVDVLIRRDRCAGPNSSSRAVALLNEAYGTPNHHSWTYDSSYNKNTAGKIIQKLPWNEYATISTSKLEKKTIGFGVSDGSYRSYYDYSYSEPDRAFTCCSGIGYAEIPGDTDGEGTSSASASASQESESFMEGDLRYEIACSIKGESKSESSGSSSYSDGSRVGSSSSSSSSSLWYMIEKLPIPGLSTYQRVTSFSSSEYSDSGGWLDVPDRDGTTVGESPASFIHKKPLGLAFMAHPKGYALVSLSDKRFVIDMDPEAKEWKVTLQFYNKKTDKLTDIIEMYNNSLKPYNKYIADNGGVEIDPLATDIHDTNGVDAGKLNQMGEFFGVLSRIPRPQLRLEQ